MNIHSTSKREGAILTERECIAAFLLQRYCNGVMGVPITFLDKYSPEQFEIVGHPQSGILPLGWKGVTQFFVDLYYQQGNTGQIKEGWINPVYVKDGKAVIPYQRILVFRKVDS